MLEIVGLILAASFISVSVFFVSNRQVYQPLWLILFSFLLIFFPFLMNFVFSRISVLQEIGLHRKKTSDVYKALLPNWLTYLFFFF